MPNPWQPKATYDRCDTWVFRDLLHSCELERLLDRARVLARRPGSASRTASRIAFPDPELATELERRIHERVDLEADTSSTIAGCQLNDHFRIYSYAQGQEFAWHTDGSWLIRPGDRLTLRSAQRRRSTHSVLVYLDRPATGGATEFKGGSQTGEAHEPRWSEGPCPGTCVVFPHNLVHRGVIVTSGVKNVLKTDLFLFEGFDSAL